MKAEAKVIKNGNANLDRIEVPGKKTITYRGSRFDIDFTEFAFLVEACIPPRPIARAMFWKDVCDKHYHSMTSSEREKLFDWIPRNPAFDLKNEDCAYFYARFNPENQFVVKCKNGEKGEGTVKLNCFKYNNRYHTSKNSLIVEEWILEVSEVKNDSTGD